MSHIEVVSDVGFDETLASPPRLHRLHRLGHAVKGASALLEPAQLEPVDGDDFPIYKRETVTTGGFLTSGRHRSERPRRPKGEK